MARIDDRTALITGAASGIGRLMALEMAARGARIVAWERLGRTGGRAEGLIRNYVKCPRRSKRTGWVSPRLGAQVATGASLAQQLPAQQPEKDRPAETDSGLA